MNGEAILNQINDVIVANSALEIIAEHLEDAEKNGEAYIIKLIQEKIVSAATLIEKECYT